MPRTSRADLLVYQSIEHVQGIRQDHLELANAMARMLEEDLSEEEAPALLAHPLESLLLADFQQGMVKSRPSSSHCPTAPLQSMTLEPYGEVEGPWSSEAVFDVATGCPPSFPHVGDTNPGSLHHPTPFFQTQTPFYRGDTPTSQDAAVLIDLVLASSFGNIDNNEGQTDPVAFQNTSPFTRVMPFHNEISTHEAITFNSQELGQHDTMGQEAGHEQEADDRFSLPGIETERSLTDIRIPPPQSNPEVMVPPANAHDQRQQMDVDNDIWQHEFGVAMTLIKLNDAYPL